MYSFREHLHLKVTYTGRFIVLNQEIYKGYRNYFSNDQSNDYHIEDQKKHNNLGHGFQNTNNEFLS